MTLFAFGNLICSLSVLCHMLQRVLGFGLYALQPGTSSDTGITGNISKPLVTFRSVQMEV